MKLDAVDTKAQADIAIRYFIKWINSEDTYVAAVGPATEEEIEVVAKVGDLFNFLTVTYSSYDNVIKSDYFYRILAPATSFG